MHLLARLKQKNISSTSTRNRHLPNKYSVDTNLLAYVGWNLRVPCEMKDEWIMWIATAQSVERRARGRGSLGLDDHVKWR